ncbi:MAG: triose-phosphate isomerase [Nitrospiraceae bacterium]|nr:MAG: triose-phosphate isomerase [Nitrospiraceae bacterium]
MRKPFISANWKMNKTIEETVEFINAFIPLVKDITDVDMLIAPPFISLSTAAGFLKGTNIKLGAQNVFYEEKGAFTGEVSPAMLLSAGCTHVILGHSERRQYFMETDEVVNKKVKIALKNGLDAILCVGESLKEREENRMFEVLDKQLSGSLKDLSMDGITIAYEPIWAIGTGKTATKEQANEAHAHIRGWLRENKEGADTVRILYGGSVTPENVASLMSEPEVDGGLVGGASLKPDSFAQIVINSRRK